MYIYLFILIVVVVVVYLQRRHARQCQIVADEKSGHFDENEEILRVPVEPSELRRPRQRHHLVAERLVAYVAQRPLRYLSE